MKETFFLKQKILCLKICFRHRMFYSQQFALISLRNKTKKICGYILSQNLISKYLAKTKNNLQNGHRNNFQCSKF